MSQPSGFNIFDAARDAVDAGRDLVSDAVKNAPKPLNPLDAARDAGNAAEDLVADAVRAGKELLSTTTGGKEGKAGKGRAGRGDDLAPRDTAATSGGGRAEYEKWLQKQKEQARAGGGRDSVFDWVEGAFQSAGLPSELFKDWQRISKTARSPYQALVELRKTDGYKARFPGLVARAKAGLPPMSEAEYLGMERTYSTQLNSLGRAKDAFATREQYGKWIAGDVSPEEVGARVELAATTAINKDPAMWKALRERGITRGEVAAFMLDAKRTLPQLQKRLDRAEVGAEAQRFGMGFRGGKKFENKLADAGVTGEQARAAFNAVAEERGSVNRLAQLGDGDRPGFKDKQLAKRELGLDRGKTDRKIRRLASAERARWSGSAGGVGQFGASSDL